MMRISLLFISIIIFSIGCGSSDKREIGNILSKRQKAFETKDVEIYLSCISPNYEEKKKGEVIGIDEIKKKFLSNVSLFDSIEINSNDTSIYVQVDKALVAQKTDVRVKIDQDESLFRLDERLGFEKVDGKWLIVKESDTDFLEGFVFGGN
ncbi:nuclear transport factor 2 family protein [Desulfobacterota bacterium AH_259_B03_O07]|nr:nuclear transport factor 2 family protein [Desulfobacterota bacterium AH_259_B03_O07]